MISGYSGNNCPPPPSPKKGGILVQQRKMSHSKIKPPAMQKACRCTAEHLNYILRTTFFFFSFFFVHLRTLRYNAEQSQSHMQLWGPDVLPTGVQALCDHFGSKSTAEDNPQKLVTFLTPDSMRLSCTAAIPVTFISVQGELCLKALSKRSDHRLPAETWSSTFPCVSLDLLQCACRFALLSKQTKNGLTNTVNPKTQI